jgi:phosphopantetheinyl transferase (holo-ACP synthase)
LPVGNDVIDLSDSDADPATLSPRFDGRVFSSSERSALARAGDSRLLRWSLWAGKEAAYKVARKLDPSAIFSPSRFVVELDDETLVQRATADTRTHRSQDATWSSGAVTWSSGSATWKEIRMHLQVVHQDGAVHAVARRKATGTEGTERALVTGLRRLAGGEGDDPGRLSAAVRRLAAGLLATPLGVDPKELEFRRERRIPQLWLRGRRAPFDLSLSHHGQMVAFAAESSGTLS